MDHLKDIRRLLIAQLLAQDPIDPDMTITHLAETMLVSVLRKEDPFKRTYLHGTIKRIHEAYIEAKRRSNVDRLTDHPPSPVPVTRSASPILEAAWLRSGVKQRTRSTGQEDDEMAGYAAVRGPKPKAIAAPAASAHTSPLQPSPPRPSPELEKVLRLLKKRRTMIEAFLNNVEEQVLSNGSRENRDTNMVKMEKMLGRRSGASAFGTLQLQKYGYTLVEVMTLDLLSHGYDRNTQLTSYLKQLALLQGYKRDEQRKEILLGVKTKVIEEVLDVTGISAILAFCDVQLRKLDYAQFRYFESAVGAPEYAWILELAREKSSWLERCQQIFDDQNTAGDGLNSPQAPSKGTSTVTHDLRLTPRPTTLVDANSLGNELVSQMHGTVADSMSPEQSVEMGEGMSGEGSTMPLAGCSLVVLGQEQENESHHEIRGPGIDQGSWLTVPLGTAHYSNKAESQFLQHTSQTAELPSTSTDLGENVGAIDANADTEWPCLYFNSFQGLGGAGTPARSNDGLLEDDEGIDIFSFYGDTLLGTSMFLQH